MPIIFIFIFINILNASEFSNINSLFAEKKFDEIISNYPAEYIISNYEKLSDDELFLYSKCLFITLDYTNSLKILEFTKTNNNKIRELKFFIFLNLKDLNLAKKEKIISSDSLFYDFLITYSETKNSNSFSILRKYLESDEDKKFNLEALLLDYTFNCRKENLNQLFEMVIKNSIITKDYNLELINSKQNNSPINDFILYKKSMKAIEKGKTEEAKKILFELIKNSSSLIIQNLASSEYQKLN